MKVRKLSDGTLYWHCVACGCGHGANSTWTFNGVYESPTFAPSFLATFGDDRRCHTFIRNGKIEYLTDCTHEFAGKVIDMVDV